MSVGTAALAILETPYRSVEGQRAPAQFAQAVDPSGVLRELSQWLAGMAEAIEPGPAEIVGEAAATLRRAAGRYGALLAA